MGPTEVGGLPAHILLVHAVIVLVPLAAGLTVASAIWPAAQRKLGILTPLAALVALISVPITTHAGEWLEARVISTPLIRRHTELADGLLPWVIGLFVVSAGFWVYARFGARFGGGSDGGSGSITSEPSADAVAAGSGSTATLTATRTTARPNVIVVGVVAVLAVIAAVGSVVEVYRIGESGSKAVWTGSFSTTPHSDGDSS